MKDFVLIYVQAHQQMFYFSEAFLLLYGKAFSSSSLVCHITIFKLLFKHNLKIVLLFLTASIDFLGC